MEKGKWESMTLEEKVEALRELVEFLAQGYLELTMAFSEVVDRALENFRERYNQLESEIFGGERL